LGSGKTTLMRNLLSGQLGDEKVAVLVNELGEIGIDGTLIKQKHLNVLELPNGCICCQIQGDFRDALEEIISKYHPDRLLIEPTGVAEPAKIIDFFWSVEEMINTAQIEPVICIVDCHSFFDLMERVGYNYMCQIKPSDIILLNKTDLVSAKELKKIEKAVKELNPRAFIFHTKYCDIDLKLLLRGEFSQPPKKKLTAKEKESHHLEDFTMFAIDWKDAMIDKEKIFSFLDNLPPEVFRLKGFINLPEGTHYLSFVTGTYDITVFPEKKNTQLVFIGKALKQDKIIAQLKKCLARGENL
jgi:G3E family GTPase